MFGLTQLHRRLLALRVATRSGLPAKIPAAVATVRPVYTFPVLVMVSSDVLPKLLTQLKATPVGARLGDVAAAFRAVGADA